METEDALAGEYVTVMLTLIALWIAFIVAGLALGGYLVMGGL